MAPPRRFSSRVKARKAALKNKSKKERTKNKRNSTITYLNNKALSSIPVSRKRKTGLQSTVGTSTIMGVVDPESNINGSIEILDNDPCDCMFVKVNPTQNVDNFFILQLIESAVDDSYIVYSRWGRTGMIGQGLVQQFDNYEGAVNVFKKKFKDKTGLDWENRNGPSIKGGKYRIIKQNFIEKQWGYNSAKWKYWVDDGIDGKPTGWYDYDDVGSRHLEQLFQENMMNPRLTNRLVNSGGWTYLVDLSQMKQINMEHPNRKSRHIRRFTKGFVDYYGPPVFRTPKNWPLHPIGTI